MSSAIHTSLCSVDIRVRDARDNEVIMEDLCVYDADDQITLIGEIQELVSRGKTVILQPKSQR